MFCTPRYFDTSTIEGSTLVFIGQGGDRVVIDPAPAVDRPHRLRFAVQRGPDPLWQRIRIHPDCDPVLVSSWMFIRVSPPTGHAVR
jgi:hypothetical protein